MEGRKIVDQFIRSFPNKKIPKQNGKLNYDKTKTIHILAVVDEASIETIRGGLKHGHLAIVLNDISRHDLIGAKLMPPIKTGPTPTKEAGLEAA